MRLRNIIIVAILLVISIGLITFSVKMPDNPILSTVKSGVNTVVSPFKNLSSIINPQKDKAGQYKNYSDEEIEKIVQENSQLKELISQLEEYRQQNMRLTTLLELSNTYNLESVSAKVLTTSKGWNQVATINKGSADGIQVGMGVMSSSGFYGQVVSVSQNTSEVKLITDASSNVSAMLQNTRETGTLTGSYDGNLVLEYIPITSSVGAGDAILTSGEGGSFPRGIFIGTVKTIETDSSDLYYRLTVDTIIDLFSCEEVLVLTGKEDSTASLVDVNRINEIKGALSSDSVSGNSSVMNSTTSQKANEGFSTSNMDANKNDAAQP
ncbi:MAG: rod shape-determining protein MreC [Coriobacteriales bacterium]|nr:rod shape-determining protein MreC [Coriobacteriales bacterium]